jgi:nucleoside triphosphate pyrophosphatase
VCSAADPAISQAPGFILASASPRRHDLLASAGLRFVVQPAEIDEAALEGEAPPLYVRRLAREKARAVATPRRAAGDRRPVLGADTIVVLDGEIIGKPADRQRAREQLERLAGRQHQVITGFCVLDPGESEILDTATTEVVFKRLSAAEIEAYLETEEWRDKAGGYAIQGRAAFMVRSVMGSYTNVVGLPLAEAVEALEQARRAK